MDLLSNSSLTCKPNSTLSWTEKELTLFVPRQPLHIAPATQTLTLIDPLIRIELYKMLNRLEFNFLVH